MSAGHFKGKDIALMWSALNLWRQVHGDDAIRQVDGVDDWNALYDATNPNQTGTVGFGFNQKRLYFLLNALSGLYAFCSSGLSFMQRNGEDVSAETARDAEELLRRIYGWMNMPTDDLPAKLAQATEGARDYAVGLYLQNGLIAPTGGNA